LPVQLALLSRDLLPEIDTSNVRCQRWSARRQSWELAHPGERLDTRNYEVKRIDRKTAKTYVVANHYSGSHVACKYSFGLYRAGGLVGVASYCVTTEAALTLVYPELVPGVESFELGRQVLAEKEPWNTETWFIARCEEILLAAGVAGIVSFADPVPRRTASGLLVFPGHVGWIYQGGNFKRAGRNTPRTQWMLPDGTFLNGITLQKIRKQRRGHEAAEKLLISWGATPMRAGQKPADWLREVRDDPTVGIRLVRHAGCHRYYKALGRTRRQRNQVRVSDRIRELTGPYPKRPDLDLAA
jgi:hypothetical protein